MQPDGDKLFMTYEGPESGPVAWIGGTGKYKDVVGSGTWTVAARLTRWVTCPSSRADAGFLEARRRST